MCVFCLLLYFLFVLISLQYTIFPFDPRLIYLFSWKIYYVFYVINNRAIAASQREGLGIVGKSEEEETERKRNDLELFPKNMARDIEKFNLCLRIRCVSVYVYHR